MQIYNDAFKVTVKAKNTGQLYLFLRSIVLVHLPHVNLDFKKYIIND